MKTFWSGSKTVNIITFLLIGSLALIGFFLVKDLTQTPEEWVKTAKEQMITHNYKKAAIYLMRAAKKGLPEAQYELALMFDVGDKIPENRLEANKWMEKAANAGMPEALYAMGVWTERGNFKEANLKTAINYYEQAAQKGYRNAMVSLIAIYADTNKDRQLFWINKLKEGK